MHPTPRQAAQSRPAYPLIQTSRIAELSDYPYLAWYALEGVHVSIQDGRVYRVRDRKPVGNKTIHQRFGLDALHQTDGILTVRSGKGIDILDVEAMLDQYMHPLTPVSNLFVLDNEDCHVHEYRLMAVRKAVQRVGAQRVKPAHGFIHHDPESVQRHLERAHYNDYQGLYLRPENEIDTLILVTE